MKILYLSGAYVPSRRASSVHVMRMCQAMAGLGHDVTLVTKDGPDSVEPDVADDYEFYGVEPVFSIRKLKRPKKRGGGLVFTWEIRRLLLTFDRAETLVYSRELFGAWIAVRSGYRVVLEAHGLPQGRLSTKLHEWLFEAVSFARFVVISQALMDLYVKIGLLPTAEKVMVAHDGADPYPVEYPNVFGSSSQSEMLRLGYVGHLYAGRGIEILIELARRLGNCELHLVGGTDTDLNFWRSQKLPDNVIFHGFVHPGELADYVDGFDILLMPYQKRVIVAGGTTDTARWMSPLKMFEYMATGKPIISSDLPVLREVLNHERNALLVGPEDIDSWETAVRRLQAEPGLAVRLGQQAQEDLLNEYTWGARAKKVLQGL